MGHHRLSRHHIGPAPGAVDSIPGAAVVGTNHTDGLEQVAVVAVGHKSLVRWTLVVLGFALGWGHIPRSGGLEVERSIAAPGIERLLVLDTAQLAEHRVLLVAHVMGCVPVVLEVDS